MGAEDKFTEAAKELGKGYLSNQYASNAGREAFLRDQHQKVLSGNPSLMKTNSVSSDPDNNKKEKKKKERDAFNRLLRQMDKMLDTMNGILDEMRDNDRKIRLAIDALKSKDEQEARRLLMDEFGMSPEEVEKLSRKETFERLADKAEITIMRQNDLKQHLKDLAVEYKAKANNSEDPELTRQYLDKLDKLEQEAKQFENVDYNKALQDVLKEGDYKLIEVKVDNSYSLNQKNEVSKPPVTSELGELNENLGSVALGEKGALSQKFTASSQSKQNVATANKKVINELDALDNEMDSGPTSTSFVKSPGSNMG